MAQAEVKTFHKKCEVLDCDNKQHGKNTSCKRHLNGDFRCTSCPPGKKFQARYGTIYEVVHERKLTKCKTPAYRTREHTYVWDNNFSNKYGKAYFTFDEEYCIFGPIHEVKEEDDDGNIVNDIDFLAATHGLTSLKNSKLFCKFCAEALKQNGVGVCQIVYLKPKEEAQIENCYVDEKFVMQLYRGVRDCEDIIKFVDEKYDEYKLRYVNEPNEMVYSSSSESDSDSDENYDDSKDNNQMSDSGGDDDDDNDDDNNNNDDDDDDDDDNQ